MKLILSLILIIAFVSCGGKKSSNNEPLRKQQQSPEEMIRGKYSSMDKNELNTHLVDFQEIIKKQKQDLCHSPKLACIESYEKVKATLFEFGILLEYFVRSINDSEENRKIEALAIKKLAKESYQNTIEQIKEISKLIQKDKTSLIAEIDLAVREINSDLFCNVQGKSCNLPQNITLKNIIDLSRTVSRLEFISESLGNPEHGKDILKHIWGKEDELSSIIRYNNDAKKLIINIEDSLKSIDVRYKKMTNKVKELLQEKGLYKKNNDDDSILILGNERRDELSKHWLLQKYYDQLFRINFIEKNFIPAFNVLSKHIMKKIGSIRIQLALPNQFPEPFSNTLNLSRYAPVLKQIEFVKAYQQFLQIKEKANYKITIGAYYDRDVFGANELDLYTNRFTELFGVFETGLLNQLVAGFRYLKVKINGIRFIFEENTNRPHYSDRVMFDDVDNVIEVYVQKKSIKEVIKARIH